MTRSTPTASTSERIRAWVYKVNSHRPGELTGWHFSTFFSYSGSKPYEMGGEGWIRSPQSWKRLKHVRAGDLFLCYQSDERRIYGLARAARPGYEAVPGSGQCNSVDFEPRGLLLNKPVPVAAGPHRAVFAHVRAFTVPSRGTIHSLAADELRYVLQVLIAENPAQRDAIQAFCGTRRKRS